MTKLTSPEAARALLERPMPRGWATGILPDAPADAICWLAPLTLGDAATEVAAAMLYAGGEPVSREAGLRRIVAASVKVNPAQWRLGAADAPEPVADDALEPLFLDPAELGDVFVEDTGVTPAAALLSAVMQASGFVADPGGDDPAADDSLAAYRARARHPGRWVAGIFPQDPEAAVWVTRYTAGQREAAETAATLGEMVNEPSVVAMVLSHVLLCGPGEGPLLTVDDARRLPYGGAQTLYRAAAALTLGGAFGQVRFLAPDAVAAAGPAEPEGGEVPAVVGDREAAPAA